ncbi:MAG TPA: sensor domain-containing diguanylate cyclase [Gemmatimonadaceae bacterium]|nr:sensor domain-containing diguanylate cyclase [Gemmatimonadaceae bacterium]
MLALIASGVAHSLLASLIASLVGISSWRWRVQVGLAVAAAGLAMLLYGDERFSRALTPSEVAALGALLLLAAIAGALCPKPQDDPDAATPAHGGAGAMRDARERDRRTPVPRGGAWQPDPSASGDRIALEITQRYLRDACAAIGADEVLLWRREGQEDELNFVASSAGDSTGASFETDPPVDSLIHWAAQQRIVATNYDADAALFLCAPVGREDRSHGVLGVYAADRHLMERDRAKVMVRRHAAYAAHVLDLLADGRNARLYQERHAVLVSAAERVQNNEGLDALEETICKIAHEVSDATRAAFVRWNEEKNGGCVAAVSSPHAITKGFRVTAESVVGNACVTRQRSTVREAYRMSPDFPLYGDGEPWRRVNSMAVVPLMRGQKVLGAMIVEGDQHGQITAVVADMLLLMASIASVALENMLRLEDVRERAATDALTGLANRRVFDEQLEKELAECDRYGHPVSLILLDIDRFKSVNDQHGHEAGDAVLVAIARTMEQVVRTIDLCARFGGEELALVLPRTPLASAAEIAERLRQAIESLHVPTGERTLSVTASFGVSCYPESADAHDALFVSADRALYQAKAAGRNCVKTAAVKHFAV